MTRITISAQTQPKNTGFGFTYSSNYLLLKKQKKFKIQVSGVIFIIFSPVSNFRLTFLIWSTNGWSSSFLPINPSFQPQTDPTRLIVQWPPNLNPICWLKVHIGPLTLQLGLAWNQLDKQMGQLWLSPYYSPIVFNPTHCQTSLVQSLDVEHNRPTRLVLSTTRLHPTPSHGKPKYNGLINKNEVKHGYENLKVKLQICNTRLLNIGCFVQSPTLSCIDMNNLIHKSFIKRFV